MIVLLFVLPFLSCKENKSRDDEKLAVEPSILEKVANAHGYDKWSKVHTLKFTFNFDRDTVHFERSWIWDVRNQEVSQIMAGDTTKYRRQSVDSTTAKVDAGFINDKYWLLAPFNLIWDKNSINYDHQLEATAPISQKPMQKLTIVYASEGGYTPGDAYDFFFEDDYLIKEWVFRKSNQPEPSTTTTWEGYELIGGLYISKMHKRASDDGSISFSNISVD